MSDELQEVRRFPVDFDALKKGDVITEDELERITGEERRTEAFHLAVMVLQQRIDTELEDRGYPVTVAIMRRELRILTDLEASEYAEKTRKSGTRKIRRSLRKLNDVDTSDFDEAQKAAHERRLLMHGRVVAAIRQANKLSAVEPVQRRIPKAPAAATGE